jgi:hypothetical protein
LSVNIRKGTGFGFLRELGTSLWKVRVKKFPWKQQYRNFVDLLPLKFNFFRAITPAIFPSLDTQILQKSQSCCHSR